MNFTCRLDSPEFHTDLFHKVYFSIRVKINVGVTNVGLTVKSYVITPNDNLKKLGTKIRVRMTQDLSPNDLLTLDNYYNFVASLVIQLKLSSVLVRPIVIFHKGVHPATILKSLSSIQQRTFVSSFTTCWRQAFRNWGQHFNQII